MLVLSISSALNLKENTLRPSVGDLTATHADSERVAKSLPINTCMV